MKGNAFKRLFSSRFGEAMLLVILFHFAALLNAQVTPGKGVGKVNLGDSPEALKNAMGPPYRAYSMEEEKEAYESDLYDTRKELPFFLKFDMGYDYYGDGLNPPVFKVFFRERKAVFFTISSYVTTEDIARATGTPNAIHLLDPVSVLTAAMGEPDWVNKSQEGDDYFYFSKGFGAFVDRGQVMIFYVFSNLSQKQAKKYMKACNKR